VGLKTSPHKNQPNVIKPEGKINQADLLEQTRWRKWNNEMVVGTWNVLE